MDSLHEALYHSRTSAPLLGWVRPEGGAYAPQIIYSPVKLENINCVVEADDRRGAIFLGDVVCVKKEEVLQEHNIRAILSCAVESCTGLSHIVYDPRDSPNHKIDAFQSIRAHDIYSYDISRHFEEAIAFIDQHTKLGKNVLVHCHAGVSRSAAILAAFLIRQRKWTAEQAVAFIKSKRPRARPNEAFFQQLKLFASRELYGSRPASVATTPVKKSRPQSTQKYAEQFKSTPKKQVQQMNTKPKEGLNDSLKKISYEQSLEQRLKAIDKMLEIQAEKKASAKNLDQGGTNNSLQYETPKKQPSYHDKSATKMLVQTPPGRPPSQRPPSHRPPLPPGIQQVYTYPYKQHQQPFRHQYVVQPMKPIDTQAMNSYEDQRKKALGGFFKSPSNPEMHLRGSSISMVPVAPYRPPSRSPSFFYQTATLGRGQATSRVSENIGLLPNGPMLNGSFRRY